MLRLVKTKNYLSLLYHSFSYIGILHLDGQLRVDHLTKITTMVVPAAGLVAWLLHFALPHPGCSCGRG